MKSVEGLLTPVGAQEGICSFLVIYLADFNQNSMGAQKNKAFLFFSSKETTLMQPHSLDKENTPVMMSYRKERMGEVVSRQSLAD